MVMVALAAPEELELLDELELLEELELLLEELELLDVLELLDELLLELEEVSPAPPHPTRATATKDGKSNCLTMQTPLFYFNSK